MNTRVVVMAKSPRGEGNRSGGEGRVAGEQSERRLTCLKQVPVGTRRCRGEAEREADWEVTVKGVTAVSLHSGRVNGLCTVEPGVWLIAPMCF